MCKRIAWVLLLAAALPASSHAAATDCASLDALEAMRKAQVDGQIAIIDAAADAGDTIALCEASQDLMLVYRSMAKAAANCAADRAARWSAAEQATREAISGVCP